MALASVTIPGVASGQAAAGPGALARATADENHWRPTWSPDGERIAFSALVQGDYEIFVVELASGRVRALTDNESLDWRPKWSPDGAWIAFTSDRDGNRELYRLDPGSGRTERLTTTPEQEDRMSWSPDGRQLAYDVGDGAEWDLWVLDLATGQRRPLVTGPGFDGYPDWSHDGSRIAFNSNRHDPGGGAPAREIHVVDVDSGDVNRLTHNQANDQAPAWSPDGTRIAYFSTRDGNSDIYTVGRGGEDEQRLTWDPEWDFMPAWSPDGSRIAWDSRRDGRRAIWIMGTDGSDPTKITNLALSPFVHLVAERGVGPAIEALRASAEGGALEDFFLEPEVLALARGRMSEQPLEALRLLELNVEAHPGSTTGWIALGDAFLANALARAAREAYLEALRLDPGSAAALAGLKNLSN